MNVEIESLFLDFSVLLSISLPPLFFLYSEHLFFSACLIIRH